MLIACRNSGGSASSKNLGAIIGGTVGGVASLIILGLIALFFWRRHKFHQQGGVGRGKRASVDLLNEEGGNHGGAGATAALAGAGAGAALSDGGHHQGTTEGRPMSQTEAGARASVSSLGTNTTGTPIYAQYRRGSAPSLPPLNFGSESGHGGTTDGGHGMPPFNRNSSSQGRQHPPSAFPGAPRPETPTTLDGTSVRTPGQRNSLKGGMPPPALRPVNIIQHDDAGEVPVPGTSSGGAGEEIVELPPSYQEVRKNSGLPPVSPAAEKGAAPS